MKLREAKQSVLWIFWLETIRQNLDALIRKDSYDAWLRVVWARVWACACVGAHVCMRGHAFMRVCVWRFPTEDYCHRIVAHRVHSLVDFFPLFYHSLLRQWPIALISVKDAFLNKTQPSWLELQLLHLLKSKRQTPNHSMICDINLKSWLPLFFSKLTFDIIVCKFDDNQNVALSKCFLTCHLLTITTTNWFL